MTETPRALPVDLQNEHSRFLRTNYFASLDGLRAISILAVIWYHVPELRPFWRTGFLGVHLFFVISGFLITTLLLRERSKTGSISLRNFYVRRTLRIFPAYYLTLGLFLLNCLLIPELRQDALPTYLHNLPSFLTYTSNWFVYPWGPGRVVFVAAWSLATEEQFYLFWPWILAATRRWYIPAGIMVSLIVITNLIKIKYGYWFFLSGAPLPIVIFNSVSTAICLGCLLAMTLHNKRSFEVAYRVLGQRWSAPLFFTLMLIASCVPNDDILHVGHMGIIAITMVLALGACTVRPDHLLKPLLTNAVARYIGMVSYGLYLYHAFGVNIVDKFMGFSKPYPALQFVLVTGTTLALASLSYWLFEKRFLDLKDRFTTRSKASTVETPVAIAAVVE